MEGYKVGLESAENKGENVMSFIGKEESVICGGFLLSKVMKES